MNDGTDLNNQLRHFTGGDSIYHHGLVKSFNYTDTANDIIGTAP